jgi:hypothetical protein
MLPDGGMLIANKQDIVRLDSAGRIITRYNSSGESCWVSLTLDPDGKSFWAVDYCSSDIIHFDITSGNQLTKFNSGTPTQTVFGIAMRGATIETIPAAHSSLRHQLYLSRLDRVSLCSLLSRRLARR